MTLDFMKVIIAFTFCCVHLWKSKIVALEEPGKLRECFSPTLWSPRISFSGNARELSSLTFLTAGKQLPLK